MASSTDLQYHEHQPLGGQPAAPPSTPVRRAPALPERAAFFEQRGSAHTLGEEEIEVDEEDEEGENLGSEEEGEVDDGETDGDESVTGEEGAEDDEESFVEDEDGSDGDEEDEDEMDEEDEDTEGVKKGTAERVAAGQRAGKEPPKLSPTKIIIPRRPVQVEEPEDVNITEESELSDVPSDIVRVEEEGQENEDVAMPGEDGEEDEEGEEGADEDEEGSSEAVSSPPRGMSRRSPRNREQTAGRRASASARPTNRSKVSVLAQTAKAKTANVRRRKVPSSGEEEEEDIQEEDADHLNMEEPYEELDDLGADDESLSELSSEIGDEGEGQKSTASLANKLTRRQLAKIDGYEEDLMLELPAAESRRRVLTAEEAALKKSEVLRRRAVHSQKKAEREKEETINKLLKKQAGKRTKEDVVEDANKEKGNLPPPAPMKLLLVNNAGGCTLSLPPGMDIVAFEVFNKKQRYPPPIPTCSIEGCTRPRKYRHPGSNKPVCGLQHYRLLSADVTPPATFLVATEEMAPPAAKQA